MFGKKKEEFTIVHLGELIKLNNETQQETIEEFKYNSEELVLVLVDKLGSKSVRRVSRVKNKYVFIQAITGQLPGTVKVKKLIEIADLFPIEPETKKTLSKKYY